MSNTIRRVVIRSMVLTAVVLAASCAAASRPSPSEGAAMTPDSAARTVALGIWGGQGVVLRVESTRSTLDFDCGHGSIEAPFVTSADGSFDLAAGIVQERPGPVLVGEQRRAPQPARASGRLTGSTMTLTVKGVDADVTFGPFSLTKGAEGRIVKCR